MKPKGCHDANFVITHGNLWCHQWWQSQHHDNTCCSVINHNWDFFSYLSPANSFFFFFFLRGGGGTIAMGLSVCPSICLSTSLSVTLLWFPHIFRQTAHSNDIKLRGYIHYGIPQTLLVFGHAPPNIRCFLASDWLSRFHTFVDKPLIRFGWAHALWASPNLINFWSHSTEFMLFPGFWLVEQFLCICSQTTDQMRLQFGGPTHFGPPQAWLTFGAPLNFRCFLATDWSSSFCTFADKLLIRLGSNLVG